MPPKTLIVNGSPRQSGDTATLLTELRHHLHGEVLELSAFRSNIAPCIDCRHCWSTARCAVEDDMSLIYSDDFDNVVLATPVYFCTLPGPVLGLMSRFQPQHAATFFLNNPIVLKPKKAGLILVAGGKGNEAEAAHHIRVFFKMLNASGHEAHTVLSGRTDHLPAIQDQAALRGVQHLARWLEEP